MNFDKAFEVIIGAEGGYVNDPQDPGGETKFGISKRSYPALDIANLTLDEAKNIYRTEYWVSAQCDKMPWPLSLFVFDCAVNQGVVVAEKLLQKSLDVAQDGIIGKRTLAAIGRADQAELGSLFLADRALRYVGTRNFDVYGRGWFRRLFVVAAEARARA